MFPEVIPLKTKMKQFRTLFLPDDKSLGLRILIWFMTLAALTGASYYLGRLSLYFSAGDFGQDMLDYYLGQPNLVLLNVLPFVLLSLLVWFISNRAWVGFLTSGIVCLCYSWAEFWKLLSRSEPIYAEELVLIREAFQMGTHYIEITADIVWSLVQVLLITLVLFLFFRGKFRKARFRLILPMLVLLSCGLLYRDVYTSSRIYNSFSVKPGLNQWADNNRFVSRGGMYPFLYSIQNAFQQAPEGYNAQETAKMLREYETDPIPEDQKVSVICVMFEAFSDFSDYTDRITQGDPYAAYHTLRDESVAGKLVTNIFAGGTVDTERCVITGYNEVAAYRHPVWSYARYFGENGYALNGSHPSMASFYSRSTVNASLGISNYLFLENHYQDLTGGISMDCDLLPEIARICLEDMEAGTPVFSYNVTYQNHGPYGTEALNRFAGKEFVPQGDLDDASYYIVNNYLNGVEDTAQEMLRMADTFRDREEPVILVFFGDHKPWLGDQGYVYPLLGIDFEHDAEQGFYNKYSTEYLIWANDAAKKTLGDSFVGTGPTISPCFLMNVLFDRCGWEGPSYQKLTDEVMAQLPVVFIWDRYLENGSYVQEEALSPESRALLQRLRNAQYYLANQSGGKLPQ